MPPKIFVSHASEDKDRFVLQFAERLRQKGIDAWLDKWEMLPGDSIVDKIFEEGLRDATAVIIVLSKFSVEKPWVIEELNAAFVKRVNSGSKLIPVVLDDCKVPEALNSTLWESITDLSSYDSSFERIVASVFGANDKPPIGLAPRYVQSLSQSIGGLSKIDSLILCLSCEEMLNKGDIFVNPSAIFLKDNDPLIPEGELEDSLEILDSEGYIKLIRTLGGGFSPYQVTTYGFEVYAKTAIPTYQEKVSAVVSAIVNEKLRNNAELQERLRESKVIIDHILNVLESHTYIRQVKMLGGLSQIITVSPSLKRALSGS